MNSECKTYFGSISGGSAFKFGLFQKRATGEWVKGSSQKPRVLSEQEALEEGKKIRDALVKGARIIQNAKLDSIEAYEQLDDDLRIGMNYDLYNLAWIHKYFSMICSDKLSGFHSQAWQLHVLRSLRIKPSEKYYARSGQIAMVQKIAGLHYCLMNLFSVSGTTSLTYRSTVMCRSYFSRRAVIVPIMGVA